MLSCVEWFGIAVLIAIVLALEAYCYRKRGIGFCAILAIIPNRCCGYGQALLHARDSEMHEVRPQAFELTKWRPWRPEPSGAV
jgi:hypothetical protein